MEKKYTLGWKQIEPKEPLSIASLKEYLMDIFKETNESQNGPWTGIKHYEGIDEDGFEYEYWVVNGMMMGRGGYEMFMNALIEEANVLHNSVKGEN